MSDFKIANYIEKGGITYDSNKAQYSYDNENKKHILIFDDGAKLTYSTQDAKNKSNIAHSFTDNYVFTNISGAIFTGAVDRNDVAKFEGCNNCVINLSNDNLFDSVDICHSDEYKSKSNVINFGKDDTVYIYDDTATYEDNHAYTNGIRENGVLKENEVRDKKENGNWFMNFLREIFDDWSF